MLDRRGTISDNEAVRAAVADRRLSELNPGFVALGVTLAPVPAALITLMLAMVVKELPPQMIVVWAGVLLSTSVAWAMIAAISYGLAVTSWRRRISRTECLVSGAILGALFPLAVVAFRHYGPHTLLYALALPPRRTPLPPGILDWVNATDYFIVAACLLLGILGGWTFWSIAARPASDTQSAPVQ